MVTRKKRLAILTKDENALWEKLFSDYMNDGKSESSADRLTWRDLQKAVPRLQSFDGCKP